MAERLRSTCVGRARTPRSRPCDPVMAFILF
jgi:hypothetical protein